MKPFPHQPEKRYQVTVGNMVSIFCPPPVSNPAALIEYYHDNHKLSSPSARILTMPNSLLLLNVTEQDSGVYTCSATNYITGQTIQSPFRVVLSVVPNQSQLPSCPRFLAVPQNNYVVQSGKSLHDFPPKKNGWIFSDFTFGKNSRFHFFDPQFVVFFIAGSNMTIECSAVGEPPPKVRWFKVGDSQWHHNNRIDYVPGGLHIRNIVPDDTGEYVCEMDNEISPILRHKVLLHVQGAYSITVIANILGPKGQWCILGVRAWKFKTTSWIFFKLQEIYVSSEEQLLDSF